MDFLSDTARKEKRNLLATGSVGILVGWLGVDQTEIQLAGFKFHDVNLPALVGWSLLAIITYLLAKFCFSYFYERFNSEMKMYAAQISEGKTALDINREEKEIIEGSRLLIEQQQVYLAQQKSETRRIADLQAITENKDRDYEAALKSLDLQRSELQEALKKANGPHYVEIPSKLMSIDPTQIPHAIEVLGKERSEFSNNRQKARQVELDYLRDEKNRSEGNEKVRQGDLKKAMEDLDLKRTSVSKWRQANKGATIVGPLHLFLDVGLPILVGLVAIGFLTWFVFHPPPPSIPASLPEL